jgi:hypothetical protein
MITMSHPLRHASRASLPAVVPSSPLAGRLSALIEGAQQSDYLFGSSLGPFYDEQARQHYVPHFVYFGAQSSIASLRLALLSGLGRHDLPASRALVAFIEGLVRRPDLGEGLNLSFFPVVNVAGLLGGAEERDLSEQDWAVSDAPELKLLNKDIHLRGYEGFVRVVSSPDEAPYATVRTTRAADIARSDVELFNSDDFSGWPVRFESPVAGVIQTGPLSLAADLPFAPFEVELALPGHWSQPQADRALAAVMKRLIVRYRGVRAYGQHL